MRIRNYLTNTEHLSTDDALFVAILYLSQKLIPSNESDRLEAFTDTEIAEDKREKLREIFERLDTQLALTPNHFEKDRKAYLKFIAKNSKNLFNCWNKISIVGSHLDKKEKNSLISSVNILYHARPKTCLGHYHHVIGVAAIFTPFYFLLAYVHKETIHKNDNGDIVWDHPGMTVLATIGVMTIWMLVANALHKLDAHTQYHYNINNTLYGLVSNGIHEYYKKLPKKFKFFESVFKYESRNLPSTEITEETNLYSIN